MPTRRSNSAQRHLLPSLIFMLAGILSSEAQSTSASPDSSSIGWQRYDWLKPADDQNLQSATNSSLSATSGQDLKDPNAVLSTGSLWQEKYGAVYTHHIADTLSLTYETSGVTLSDGQNPYLPQTGEAGTDLYREQSAGLQFQPISQLTLRGNLHESTSDTAQAGDDSMTTGANFSVESHLPFNSTLTLALNSNSTSTDSAPTYTTTDTTYDAQLQQPLGKVPLTAVLKGHYEETTVPGSPINHLPSLEQSLVWKPVQDTTLQMGLRQQQYQEYPGITDELNEALFADWSQKVAGDVSWHSYAEVLNSRGLLDQAPASPIASGSNGTAQATGPGSNASLTSSLPISFEDQTVTFSTGPSFKLQQDISASIEYSDRWDKNPAAGGVGQEQRVSVSVKGTF